MIYMKFNLCIRWLSVQYNNKKRTFWVFIQLIRWARCDLYYIFTVIDSYRQKKKKNNNTGVGGNGSHSSGSGTGFSSSFFVGLGREEIKVCDAFGNRRWAPGLMRHLAWETRSQRLTFSHYLGSTHILNAFGRIQMSHFNLDI